MGAALDQPAVFQDDDPVRGTGLGEPVRDDQRWSPRGPGGVRAVVEHLPSGAREPLEADAILFATGHCPIDATRLLGPGRRPPDRPQLRGGARRHLLPAGQPQGPALHPGGALLREYCADRGLPYDECGKLVVAVNPDEEIRLDALAVRAGTHRLGQVTAIRNAPSPAGTSSLAIAEHVAGHL